LLSNAIKFSHEGSTVQLSLIHELNEWKIIVEDKGVGIDADMIQKLFKIDDSISTKGTKNESGTGLGLILCNEFVNKHRGSIAVESKPGNGSQFIVSIPSNLYKMI
jgi:signal transduction histidine kinase